MSLKLVEEAGAKVVVDQRTGLRFAVPPGGQLEPAGMAPGFAYCGRYRCPEPAVEFRVALKQITPEMLELEPALHNQIYSMCQMLSEARGTKAKLLPAKPLASQWNADAVVLAEYGKKSPEDGYDVEKCFVIGKGDHMTLVLMLFDSRMSPKTSLQLVNRLVNSLHWPNDGQQAPSLQARPERPESPFKLEPSGASARVIDTRTGFGIGVPAGGGLMGGGSAWDELFAVKAFPFMLRIRLRDNKEMGSDEQGVRLQLMAFLTGVANRAGGEPSVTRLDELASTWGVDFAVMAEYPLRRKDPPFDHEKQFLFGKGDHSYLVCMTVSAESPPGSTVDAVKTMLAGAHWPAGSDTESARGAMAGAGGTPAADGPPPESRGGPPSAPEKKQLFEGPSGPELAAALGAYGQGQLSKAALMRLVAYYEGWQVPSQNAADGSPALRMLAGQAGEWWLMLFSNKQAMETYDSINQSNLSSSFFGARGSSVINNLPGGAAGIGIDSGQPHAAFFNASDLPLLREYGQAYEVEAAIGQTSKRDNKEEIIREYPGFRVLGVQNGWALMEPEPNIQVLPTFTTEDALEAFFKTEQGSQMKQQFQVVRVSGAELLGRALKMDTSLTIFNLAGPTGKAAFGKKACAAIMGQPAPQAAPSSSAGPVSSSSDAGRAPAETEVQAPQSAANHKPLIEILPQIQPFDWPGLKHTVVKPIHNRLEAAGGGQTVPWVSWCFKSGDRTSFIGQEWLDLQCKTAQQVHEESLGNLMKLRPKGDVMEAKADGKTFKVGFFSGPYAAEQILNEATMHIAHNKLEAQRLAVAIPIRGNLIAAGLDYASQLVPMAYRLLDEPGQLVLTKMVFIVEYGVIVGKLRIG